MAESPTKSLSRIHPLVWAERPMDLQELVEDVSLPAVVKIHTDGKPVDSSSALDQPLLLYKEVKGVKVVARNVSSLETVGRDVNKEGMRYKEGDSMVFFPVDYPGWFRVLEEESVPINTISSLARVMPVSFLSTKKLPGFSMLNPETVKNPNDIMYEKLNYPAGLYYVHNIYEDYVKYKDNKHVTKRKLLRCLVCVAEEGLEALFPFDVQGDFYIVEGKAVTPKSVVSDKNAYAYTLKQLVTMGAFTRPLVLQVLIGDPPSKPCGFTGIVKVCDIIQERTVIASCLDGSRKLMELPVLPYPQFVRALNGKDLLETGSLRPELMFMSGGAADKYAREIKFRQNIPMKQDDKEPSSQKPKKQAHKQPIPSNSPRRGVVKVKPGHSQSFDMKQLEKDLFITPFDNQVSTKSTDKPLLNRRKDKHISADNVENHIYINPFEGQFNNKQSTDKLKSKPHKDEKSSKNITTNTKL